MGRLQCPRFHALPAPLTNPAEMGSSRPAQARDAHRVPVLLHTEYAMFAEDWQD
jgi:hypothetical protein